MTALIPALGASSASGTKTGLPALVTAAGERAQ
jgi:hypothetical protein